MNRISLVVLTTAIATTAFGSSDIEVKVTSLNNAANSTILEACGTAVHKTSPAPLLVSVKHGDALYTTMTGQQGKWCVLIKRWNFKGTIDVSGATIDGSGSSPSQAFMLPSEQRGQQ